VTRILGERPVLPPAGHPAVHESGITGEHLVRTDTESLGYTGPKAFDDSVYASGEIQNEIGSAWVLEVDSDGALVAVQHRERVVPAGVSRSVDSDDLGAHVAEEHPGEGRWTDAAQFEYSDTGERTP